MVENGIYRLFWYCISIMFSLNEDRGSRAFRCLNVRFVFGRSCGVEHQTETYIYVYLLMSPDQKVKRID